MSDPQSAKFKERISAVFEHAQAVQAPTTEDYRAWRYVPRELPGRTTAGGWGVWDRKLNKMLNAREVYAVPLDQLKNEVWADA